MTTIEAAHARLEQLYEISKLFASFENVAQTFSPALAIATRTLPLHSAILIETEGAGRSRMTVWHSGGGSAEHLRAAKEHIEAAYGYLVGAPSSDAPELSEQAGMTSQLGSVNAGGTNAHRFIVIPLVVAHRTPFGALQLEAAQPLTKTDLIFANAIANQLAIALDRDRAWRRDITRRDVAEAGQIDAQERGAESERERLIAESTSGTYEALARENALLYEKAQRAVRVREQILAIVSHDLKNPLGTILMATGVLAQRGAPAQHLGRIQRSAERMLSLIEDLLDFASIEAGQLSIKRQPHDPGEMIDETLGSFESIAQERRLRLRADVEPGLPAINCDRDRILQVLSNLVGNATKATAEGGHVDLRVEAQGQELLFSVSDNGPGISEEDVNHLFERYWRSGEAHYEGTGLGLAIAKGIIDAHGGRIWAESELGRGARFFFTVPTA